VHRPARRLLLVAAATLLLAGACSSGGSGAAPANGTNGSGRSSVTTAPRVHLEWRSCGGIQCATLEVPLDHRRPDGPTIDIALGRLRASGRNPIGTLVVNPGGPGGSGIDLVRSARTFLDPGLLERFDVVGWDPRGVGDSTPVECLDDLDPFFAVDHTPDDRAEVDDAVRQAKRLVEGCKARSGSLLAHLSTTETVRDLDAIRAAVGDERLTYLGFSYGTYIGARYAEVFPTRVRALVLDGAVDPALSAEEVTREQAVGLDTELRAFFAWCDGHSSECRFGGGAAEQAYRRLADAIDARPVPVGARALGPGTFDIGVAWSLYGGEEVWPVLGRALADAAGGDGRTLLAIADDYAGRRADGSYTNETEAFYATGCLDAPSPRTLAGVERLAARVGRAAPYFGTASAWLGLPCTYWPVPADFRPREIHAPGAPPILVLGTTGDPATPVTWARSLARQLDSGRLVIFDGHGHTAAGRGNDCIDGVVRDYLAGLRVPAEGTVCAERS
jgi:pimeloyl-ACP methyl ester carboxylesterase